MRTVNIHEAKTHLSRLIAAAAAGEEIIIARAGKPLVKLVGLTALQGPRVLGSLAGKVFESPDWWVPDRDLEALFYRPGVEPARASTRAGRVAERRRRK